MKISNRLTRRFWLYCRQNWSLDVALRRFNGADVGWRRTLLRNAPGAPAR